MKKVRFILAAIATLGVMGGALAYKAKRYGAQAYCYTTTTDNGALCCLSAPHAAMLGGAPVFKYTTTVNAAACGHCVPCSKVAASIGG